MGQQSQSATNTKLNRIAWLSKQEPGKKYECLMHLFNPESLIECFHELDKNKAVGIDGVTKMGYGAFTWEKFQLYMMADPLPKGKIVHPLF